MARKSDNVTLPAFITRAVERNEVQLIGKGIECQVYLIVKDKLVCKIFMNHAEAEYSYRLQRIAYRAGIAPQPMGFEYNYYFSRFAGSITTTKGMKKFNIYSSKKFKDFIEEVVNIFGGRWSDLHRGNVGVLKIQGIVQFFVIDFGVCGFETTVLGQQLSIKLNVTG